MLLSLSRTLIGLDFSYNEAVSGVEVAYIDTMQEIYRLASPFAENI